MTEIKNDDKFIFCSRCHVKYQNISESIGKTQGRFSFVVKFIVALCLLFTLVGFPAQAGFPSKNKLSLMYEFIKKKYVKGTSRKFQILQEFKEIFAPLLMVSIQEAISSAGVTRRSAPPRWSAR